MYTHLATNSSVPELVTRAPRSAFSARKSSCPLRILCGSPSAHARVCDGELSGVHAQGQKNECTRTIAQKNECTHTIACHTWRTGWDELIIRMRSFSVLAYYSHIAVSHVRLCSIFSQTVLWVSHFCKLLFWRETYSCLRHIIIIFCPNWWLYSSSKPG